MRSLHDLLPSFWTEVYEIDEILKAEQVEFNSLYEKRFNFLDNLFLSTADDEGLARYEKIYGILKGSDQSIEERRYIIKTAMTDKRPMTFNYLKEFLTGLCGEDEVEISLDNYTLSINLTLPNANVESIVKKFIKNAIPANIELDLNVDYSIYQNMQYRAGDN